jgi:hypothetical protein
MQIGLLGLAAVVGVVIGWFIRADRCAREKIAVNASWQDQLESQQSEHARLAEQNKSLMEQISQYQASHKDHTNRARELSDSLKEAFARRDELQRQLKDMRARLELAVAQRNKAREELELRPADQGSAMKEKDDKIFKLSRELTSWQSRVPPLVERFQTRDREARALEEELASLRTELQALEERVRFDHTRIEPVDAETLPDGGDASNEPIAMTAAHETRTLQDQIDDGIEEIDELEDFVDPVGEDDLQPVTGTEDFDEVFAAGEGDAAPDEVIQLDAAHGDEDDTDDAPVGDEADSDDTVSGEGPVSGSDDETTGEYVAADEAADDSSRGEQAFDAAPTTGHEPASDDGESGHSDDDETLPADADLPVVGEPRHQEPGETFGRVEFLPGNGQAHIAGIGNVTMAGANGDRDELQKIKGIGPSIERTLNELGVFRFHQIAEMSEYEIDRVAQQLKGFRSRIYREDWIGQARDLQYEKNNRRS